MTNNHKLPVITSSPSSSSSPITSIPNAIVPSSRPLRSARTSYVAFIIVILFIFTVVATWTYIRLNDPRFEQIPGGGRGGTTVRYSRVQLESFRISLPYLVSVWIIVAMILWSLIQTYVRQGLNYVTREEQYIQNADHDKLKAAFSGNNIATEDELLYDLPDLFEFIPGFVLELTESCTSDSSTAASSATNSLSLPHQPPPLVSWNSGSRNGGNIPLTGRILLPTLSHKLNGCRRWCTYCQLYKPDRAHHCHRCGRCVKKMDHHCIFISSCVGFYNYKFFLLFLFYIWFASMMIIYEFFACDFLTSLQYNLSGKSIIMALLFSTCGSFAAAIPVFLGFHLKIALLHGCTTLEWNELTVKRLKYLGDNRRYVHPYQLPSVFQQWKYIFGFSIWKWFLPIGIYGSGQKVLPAGPTTPVVTSTQGNILRTAGRGFSPSDSSDLDDDSRPEVGADLELDELSAVPLLSSFTTTGTPISTASGIAAKSFEATRELASWERTHQVPQEASQFERLHPHPLYDSTTEGLYTRAARWKKAAQGVLGKDEAALMAEWQSKGLMFPCGPTILNPQLWLWRESKLFKQA